ncbi:two pore domain potassium channel family protein [filamentous cyanobacterium LEGE 11480]|uniref:Two pore domain potassium channel family protein n=2 Tax=Romeriopsis TaxID=2992131 RepID=A0A928VKV0_9CYAN|nr:two pore domain potassium channel family protein [Romeriopsis navalis LEGE 11480]
MPPAVSGKYKQLLVVLVLNFSLSPFFDGMFGELLSSALLLYTLIVIVRTFSMRQQLLQLYLGIAISAFGLQTGLRLGWFSAEVLFLAVLIQVVYGIYLGVAVYLILRDILLCQQVTVDTIRGSICVYLLIGFIWAFLYGIVASLDAQAFSTSILNATSSYGEIIYFSFVTLTTLGYGDILPVSPIARMLANLEAIVGQLYPSILIAILVSNYTAEKLK